MPPSKKIIVRIKGGLGNQMFCYAAARRLQIINNAELIIDSKTGFVRDKEYNRKYALHAFKIPFRLANKKERLEPIERYRRGIMKYLSKRKEFHERNYIEQDKNLFDKRLLEFKIIQNVIIDGLWLSQKYFIDQEDYIRKDFEFNEPKDSENKRIYSMIKKDAKSVSLHVRWYFPPDSDSRSLEYNVNIDYYIRAINFIKNQIDNPHFYIFSDYPHHVEAILKKEIDAYTLVTHNVEEEMAYADMWLMSNCVHHIIANSTFSWWGAWLDNNKEKIVIAPPASKSKVYEWGGSDQIPDEWLVM